MVDNDLVMIDGEVATMERERKRGEAENGQEEESEEPADDALTDPNYEIMDLTGIKVTPKKKSSQGGARFMTSFFTKMQNTRAGNTTPPGKEKSPRTPTARRKARSRSRSPRAADLSSEGHGTDRLSSGGEDSSPLL